MSGESAPAEEAHKQDLCISDILGFFGIECAFCPLDMERSSICSFCICMLDV